MASPKATTVTQSELTRYVKAMRAAGFDGLGMVIEKTDGTRIAICAGKAGEGVGDDGDAMIERLP